MTANTDPQLWIDLMMQLTAEYAPRLLGGILAIFLAFRLAGWAKRAIQSKLSSRNFDATLTRFFAGFARSMVLLGSALAILGIFGVETTAFAAVIGAAALAIGLAFQGTLGNFSAGIMLLVFRPFKVGDFVEVGGHVGVIAEVGIFTTEFDTPDGRHTVMPNGKIFGDTIVNMSHNANRRVDIKVGADYGADLDATKKALEKAIPNIPGALAEPEPQIFLHELGDSSVNWQVRIWARSADYWNVWQAATRATKMAMDEAGIGIPFPQMDVHVDGDARR
jgi:small conductance mechanosensitive channel